MPTSVYNKFNRGEVDSTALARDDIEKIKNSCALMNNFMPMRLGSMVTRPGSKDLGFIPNAPKLIPFIFSTSESAILEFTSNSLRIWIDDIPLSRASVTTSLLNTSFDDSSAWLGNSGFDAVAVVGSGLVKLSGNEKNSGSIYQVTTAIQANVEHTLNITIEEAPVSVRIGDLVADATQYFDGFLNPGVHSLVFTPGTDNISITLSNHKNYDAVVSDCSFATDGEQVFVTNVPSGSISSIKYSQSADVCFLTFDSGRPFQIERRGKKSWSVVDQRVDDGVFGLVNITDTTLQSSATKGTVVITSSKSGFFNPESVGDLYSLASSQATIVSIVLTFGNHGTEAIRVTGVGVGRELRVESYGSPGKFVVLQRSLDKFDWTDVNEYTTDQDIDYNDGLDNEIWFYRLFTKSATTIPGSLTFVLTHQSSSEGVLRVTNYLTPETVDAQIIKTLGSGGASNIWRKSDWNAVKGFPTAVSFYEGRLWYAGRSKIWGSVSDSYASFDNEIEGDSKAIFKTVGFGAVDNVNWLVGSSRLIMGLDTDEISVRSSSFGEVLSATNANLKTGSSQGSSEVEPIRIDDSIYFVQRSGVKVIEAEYSFATDSHKAEDLMMLNQEICPAKIKRIAVSRQPESRVFCVLANGEVRVLLVDKTEDVKAWSRIETSGLYKDVVILPNQGEDAIYFCVQRGGVFSLEKLDNMADYSRSPLDSYSHHFDGSSLITGLERFGVGSVGVWGDGEYKGTFTVSAGQIDIGEAGLDNVYVGLEYESTYISNKLGQYANYSVLNKLVRVFNVGIIAQNIHPRGASTGLSFGSDLNNLKDMPQIERGLAISATSPVADYDNLPFEFDGFSDTNSRVAMKATSPCLIMALTYGIKDTQDKANKQKRPQQV